MSARRRAPSSSGSVLLGCATVLWNLASTSKISTPLHVRSSSFTSGPLLRSGAPGRRPPWRHPPARRMHLTRAVLAGPADRDLLPALLDPAASAVAARGA